MAADSNRTAWGKPSVGPSGSESRSSSASTPNTTISRPSDFPVLGTRGPSKTATRKRSAYADPTSAHSSRFDAYPPRNDVLARIYLEQEGLYYQQQDDRTRSDEEDHENSWRQGVAELAQQNGMSSVVIYDESGKRVNAGPDIYTSRRAREKGKRRDDDRYGDKRRDDDGAALLSARTEDASINDQPVTPPELPLPLTNDRLEDLMQEHKRFLQARAAQQRLQSRVQGDEDVHNQDALIAELEKAFSSVDGFIAAFAAIETETKKEQ